MKILLSTFSRVIYNGQRYFNGNVTYFDNVKRLFYGLYNFYYFDKNQNQEKYLLPWDITKIRKRIYFCLTISGIFMESDVFQYFHGIRCWKSHRYQL